MSLAERLISHQTASGSGVVQHFRQPAILSARSSFPRGPLIHRSNSLVCCARVNGNSGHIAASQVATDIAQQQVQQTAQEEQHLHVKTRYIAETLLPTRHGKFRLRGYKHSLDGGITFTEPTAIICGQVEGKADVPLRVHDACFTSEVLGSLKCDCAEQLELALDYIQDAGCGMVIYLQQEGRGIGLANKIAAYALQEQGLDTVDANRALGLPDDCREYTSVRNILRDLGITSVQLMTNNPRKLDTLTQLGVTITGRIPCQVQAGEHNKDYLDAKRTRMQHMLGPTPTAAAAAASTANPQALQQQQQQPQHGSNRSGIASNDSSTSSKPAFTFEHHVKAARAAANNIIAYVTPAAPHIAASTDRGYKQGTAPRVSAIVAAVQDTLQGMGGAGQRRVG